MTDTPIPEGLTDAGDGTFFGAALAALRAGHEVQASELDPWRALDEDYDLPAGRYVRSRPKPVPAPPATERVLWESVVADQRTLVGTDEPVMGIAWREVETRPGYTLCYLDEHEIDIAAVHDPAIGWDGSGTVEVLVDPVPTGDDEPLLDEDEATLARDAAERGDEPQADTPAPRWVKVGPGPDSCYGDIEWNGHRLWGESHNRLPSWLVGDAWGALVELVRRDGTDPTPEAVYDELRRSGAHLAAGTIPLNVIGHVLAAVRALRDGETR